MAVTPPSTHAEPAPKPVAVAAMVSGTGRGTNLAALIEGSRRPGARYVIAVVIGTRSDAPAVERARDAGVPVAIVSPRKYEGDEAAYGAAVSRILCRYAVSLICLAGYMRKLPSGVVTEYNGRIMNIHPALLPLFGGQGMYGLHVHQAVIDSGMKVSGCTVHLVDLQYDTGPIVLQTAVPVEESDDADSLGARVLQAEHATFVRAVELYAAGRIRVEHGRAHVLPLQQAGAPPGVL